MLMTKSTHKYCNSNKIISVTIYANQLHHLRSIKLYIASCSCVTRCPVSFVRGAYLRWR